MYSLILNFLSADFEDIYKCPANFKARFPEVHDSFPAFVLTPPRVTDPITLHHLFLPLVFYYPLFPYTTISHTATHSSSSPTQQKKMANRFLPLSSSPKQLAKNLHSCLPSITTTTTSFSTAYPHPQVLLQLNHILINNNSIIFFSVFINFS